MRIVKHNRKENAYRTKNSQSHEYAIEMRKNSTEAESLLWETLRNRQVSNAKFRRQHPVGKYIADLFCAEANLAIELDGNPHLTAEQKDIDMEKEDYFKEAGITTIRFWNNEVINDLPNVIRIIQEHLPPLHRNGEGPGVRWSDVNGEGPGVRWSDVNGEGPGVRWSLGEETEKGWLEIIVVDNHSEDDSIGVIRNRLSGIENVHIVESPRNAGFGKGYKQGVHYARGTYLLINNPDKTLPPDGIAQLVAKMEADPSIGILAPKLVHGDGTARLSPRRFPGPLDVIIKRTALHRFFPKHLERYLQLRESPDTERDTDWIAGGCFLIRKDFFERLGGFDERFFLFFEDTDLCRRCWKAGKRVVYYPSVVATDKTRRLSEGSVLSLLTTPVGRAHVKSAFRYFGKWGWTAKR